jgi:predicted TIM-barrel fold metal-dependent hydrolase
VCSKTKGNLLIVDVHTHIFPRVSGIHNQCKLKSYEQGKWLVFASEADFESLRNECILEGDPTLTSPLNYGRIRKNEYWIRIWAPFIDKGFSYDLLAAYMETYGVDRAVILQGPSYYYPDLNKYISSAIKNYPNKFLGAAQVDPMGGKSSIRKLETAVKVLGLKALKLELTAVSGWMQFHPKLKLDDSRVVPIWEKADELGIPVILDIGIPGSPSFQVDAIEWMADEFPNLQIVIPHMAGGRERAYNEKIWRRAVNLARLDNVWITTEPVKPSDLECFRLVYDMVGDKKIMWGTDYPWWSKLYSYNYLMNMIRSASFIRKKEMNAIMGDNASALFELP